MNTLTFFAYSYPLFLVLLFELWGVGEYYEKIKEKGAYSLTFVAEGGFSEGSPLRQTSIIFGEAGGILEARRIRWQPTP
jgi:hypothetical protein